MAKRKITLKNKGGDSLYPRTTAQVVEVNANENLTQFLAGIIQGTKTVGKAASAANADNAGTLEGSTKEQILQEADTAAGIAAGNALTSANAYTDNAIKDVTGTATILAKTTEEGKIRLAKEADMTDPLIVDDEGYYGNEPMAVAITPYVLKRYLFGNEGVGGVVGGSNGIASLDEEGKVPASQLPSYVDDVVEYANFSSFPTRGEGSKIYVDLATNKTYRWSGSTYTEISASIAIGETTGTAYDGALGAANAAAISKILEGTTTVPKATNATTAGSATTATTAQTLASAPVLANGTTDSNKIKITAGGKTSSEFTVPYSTKAGSATSATTAEKATKDSNDNTINFSKDGVEDLIGVDGITYEYDTTGGTDEVTY